MYNAIRMAAQVLHWLADILPAKCLSGDLTLLNPNAHTLLPGLRFMSDYHKWSDIFGSTVFMS